MAKITRSTFFTVLAASGAFVLTGCGSGTPKNSNYTGSYRSAYTISSLNEAGAFNFTIDVKGRVQGTLDNQNGKVREFSGEIKNNGEINGDTFDRTNNVRGTLSGKVAGSGADATSVSGGNFTLTENNAPAVGSFEVGATIPAPGSSGYQGFYNGVYTIPTLKQNGNTTFSVDAAGKMTGSFTRGSETGLLTGNIDSTGNFTSTVTFDADTVTINGSLVKTADNSTLGNFTEVVGGKTYAGTFGPTTVTPGNSPYAGSYRGTYGVPEQNENGNVSLTVDPSGSFTGFFSQSNNSPVGTITGAFNNDGRFTGTVTYDPATGIADRPISGKIGTDASSSGFAGDFIMTINGVGHPGNMQLSVGGSEVDSIYRSSYTDGGWFPSFSSSSFAFQIDAKQSAFASSNNRLDFSIDKEGTVVGTWGPYPVSGRITNDGRIVGLLKDSNNVTHVFRGIMNQLTWTFTVPDGTEKARPGMQGNFVFLIDNNEYIATLKCVGGTGGGG